MTDTSSLPNCEFDGYRHTWEHCPHNPKAEGLVIPARLDAAQWNNLVHEGRNYILDQIDSDILSGLGIGKVWTLTNRIPWDIDSFGDLHDYVDANEYLIDWHVHAGVFFDASDDDSCRLDNDITDAISAALSERNTRGAEKLLEQSFTDGPAYVWEVPWLPESHRYVVDLFWSGSEFYAKRSHALLRFGLLVACAEDERFTGFFKDNEKDFAHRADSFIYQAVEFC